MKKIVLLISFLLFVTKAYSSQKERIIENLKNLENLSFKFEQNINGKIENGKCTIEYPKKINCSYNSTNNKIMVSNGKSLVIKTKTSYYIYPIEKTPLNFLLDKEYLLTKINKIDERILDDKFINYAFNENENQINLFFDKQTHNLIGWQTIDVYQNLSITYLTTIYKNKKLDRNFFKLPKQN